MQAFGAVIASNYSNKNTLCSTLQKEEDALQKVAHSEFKWKPELVILKFNEQRERERERGREGGREGGTE